METRSMPAEITMPQLSDTMTEGTLIKWNKKEGDRVRAGEEIAEVETDKASMPMEAFESGTLALISVKEGEKVPVGGLMGVIAKSGENVEEIKKSYAGQKTASSPAPASAAKTPTTSPSGQEPRGSIRPGSSQAAGGTSTPAAPKPTPA